MLIGVPGLPPAARGHRDGRPADRAARRDFVFNTAIGIDIPFEQLQRDYDAIAITAGAMNAGRARRARARTSTASSTASTS